MQNLVKKSIYKEPIIDRDDKKLKERKDKVKVIKSEQPPNGCFPLNNEPERYHVENYVHKTLEEGENLKYDFTNHFPPKETNMLINVQASCPLDRSMSSRHVAHYDDRHRFVYLAQNKPKEPAVGDCFIRLEVIHKRMVFRDPDIYIDDCNAAMTLLTIKNAPQTGVGRENANKEYREAQRRGRTLLTFRCWSVEGVQCATLERYLYDRLFPKGDCGNTRFHLLRMFYIWAELLRNSQGDKLASKDFFGRYWDAVIPPADNAMFATGFLIVIDGRYVGYRSMDGLGRDEMKNEVCEAVGRVLGAARLKFKPPLTRDNVRFFDEAEITQLGPWTEDWYKDGWRSIEPHPGGLYSIYVSRPVREFLCRDTHDKQLWQERYPAPQKQITQDLDELLTNCEKTETTRTEVVHDNVVAARKGKRKPTQDKCVAKKGYSANAALSTVYPDYYPSVAKAKKRRVAEWLHRYEAFVKRLAYYSNNEEHDTVVVITEIHYPVIVGWGHGWIWKAGYTWLAPRLFYGYSNDKESKPHVLITRNLHPLNRESCMLFEALLDKSIENMC
ncbi:hypothetical protein H9Q69_012031 [Fusarium xylarioides]|nr:hypothetical protein H9Q69_012031 [Fusarium xylarioides]